MKRTLITLIAVLTFLCGTQAQETATKMVVKKVDNTQITLAVDDVDEITFTEEEVTFTEEVTGHDYVDLGLPSGTLWATCNVGANSPEEYGDYFAWGETTPKEVYNWNTYKWCEGHADQLTKYCYDSSCGYNGFTDDKTELDLEDDAAYVNWGSDWRMPSIEQIQELIDKCTCIWTTLNGINGYEVTGPNGNSIFLPAAGCLLFDILHADGAGGFYSSRSLDSSRPYNAYELEFGSDTFRRDLDNRHYGLSVRAVLKQETVTMMVIKKVDNTQLTIAVGDVDEITFIEEEVHDYVDLGLPSGTLWATCNVGANSPEEYGDYFAWGETEPKEHYDYFSYKWAESAKDRLTKYCYDSSCGYNGFTDDKRELDLEDDAAYVNWGSDWRMPSKEQQDELREKCTWTSTTLNGVKGRKVTGPNGNSIFLPAAGYRVGISLDNAGSWGNYWSRSLDSDDPICAYKLYFGSDDVDWFRSRCFGESVRAVRR